MMKTDDDQKENNTRTQNSIYAYFEDDMPLKLDCGKTLHPLTIAYQTYGTLNEQKSNAILICHALTGDQFCAGKNPITQKNGWWHHMIGPGKSIDTDRYFVICSNSLGSCSGTTGPQSLNPKTNKPYNLEFPIITIADMVRAQNMLIETLQIPSLLAVIGGSMGGMQALEWAAKFPDKVFAAVIIAAAAKHSAQNIAFHEVGRQAVTADPNWHGGQYNQFKTQPKTGLAVARMAAHITYLSETALHKKFGRNLQNKPEISFGFDADFQVESYLRYQGSSFVERFDANSYLYLTRAMDYFDIAGEFDNILANAFIDTKTRFCIISFTSDWLFPTGESRNLTKALNAVAANVSFVDIETNNGHDSFLLHEPELFNTITAFLDSAMQKRSSPA